MWDARFSERIQESKMEKGGGEAAGWHHPCSMVFLKAAGSYIGSRPALKIIINP